MTSTTRPSEAAPIPLACVPGVILAAERTAHFQLIMRLFTTAAREKRRLPDGYAYRFDADAFNDLAGWITNERRYCRFLAFTIELRADHSPIWVRLTGPMGTNAFLNAELPAA